MNVEGDDGEGEADATTLVDKRRLKSIIVDTRDEKKQELKELRDASLISRHYPQPPPSPVNQPGNKGGTSSTQPDLVNRPGIEGQLTTVSTSDPVNQPGNEEKHDAQGNVLMHEETANEETQENEETDKDFDPFITQEYVEQVAREEELEKKSL